MISNKVGSKYRKIEPKYWQKWSIRVKGETKEAVAGAIHKITCDSYDMLDNDKHLFYVESWSTSVEEER